MNLCVENEKEEDEDEELVLELEILVESGDIVDVLLL